MIPNDILSLLQCPSCASALRIIDAALLCEGCQTTYASTDGIFDLVPPVVEAVDAGYETDALMDLIAGVYDWVAPAMSLAVWNCSPLRYVDSENRALGRANGGVYVKAPIGTGVVLNACLADYHNVDVLCLDSSLKMLRRAKSRLDARGLRVHFFRVDFGHLPLRDGVARGFQSLNGLHGIHDRAKFIAEARRVTSPHGFVSGSALVRGETPSADVVLNRYERMGVFPMLRTAPYLVEQIKTSGVQVHHATHGAVLFFDFENPS